MKPALTVACLLASLGLLPDGAGAQPNPAAPTPPKIRRLCVEPELSRCKLTLYQPDGRPAGEIEVDAEYPDGLAALDRGNGLLEVQWRGRSLLVSRLDVVFLQERKPVLPGVDCRIQGGVRNSGCGR